MIFLPIFLGVFTRKFESSRKMFTIAENNTCKQSKSRVISNLSQNYMKTKTNKTGWVIRNIKTGRFLAGKGRYDNTTKLENAAYLPTRSEARESRYIGEETVQKVLLKDETPIKVISGNGPNCRW